MIKELPLSFIQNTINDIARMSDQELYDEMQSHTYDESHKGIATYAICKAELVRRGIYD